MKMWFEVLNRQTDSVLDETVYTKGDRLEKRHILESSDRVHRRWNEPCDRWQLISIR